MICISNSSITYHSMLSKCYAMQSKCYAMLCHAMPCYATLCYPICHPNAIQMPCHAMLNASAVCSSPRNSMPSCVPLHSLSDAQKGGNEMMLCLALWLFCVCGCGVVEVLSPFLSLSAVHGSACRADSSSRLQVDLVISIVMSIIAAAQIQGTAQPVGLLVGISC